MRDEPCISHCCCIIRDCFSPRNPATLFFPRLFFRPVAPPLLSRFLPSLLSFPVPRPTGTRAYTSAIIFGVHATIDSPRRQTNFSPAPIAKSASAAAQRGATQRDAGCINGGRILALLLPYSARPSVRDRWRASFPFSFARRLVRSINFAFPGAKLLPGGGSRREFSREKRDRETLSRIRFCRQAARELPYLPARPASFSSISCVD